MVNFGKDQLPRFPEIVRWRAEIVSIGARCICADGGGSELLPALKANQIYGSADQSELARVVWVGVGVGVHGTGTLVPMVAAASFLRGCDSFLTCQVDVWTL